MDLASEAGGEDDPGRLAYGYRSSSVAPSQVVLWAAFRLEPGSRDAGSAALARDRAVAAGPPARGGKRRLGVHQPPGDSAGRLVEAAGLRGHRLDSAQVSPKHANFIQADPGGSADDVLALVRRSAQVRESSGVALHTEVRLIGFPAERDWGGAHTGRAPTTAAPRRRGGVTPTRGGAPDRRGARRPHPPVAPGAAPDRAARPPGMDPRIAQRRDEVARHRGRRRTRVLLALLVLAGLVVAIWFVLHTPLFSARHVTVVGSADTPDAEIAAAAGLGGHPPLIDVDTGAVAAKVEQLPWVATAAGAGTGRMASGSSSPSGRRWPPPATRRPGLARPGRPTGGAAAAGATPAAARSTDDRAAGA